MGDYQQSMCLGGVDVLGGGDGVGGGWGGSAPSKGQLFGLHRDLLRPPTAFAPSTACLQPPQAVCAAVCFGSAHLLHGMLPKTCSNANNSSADSLRPWWCRPPEYAASGGGGGERIHNTSESGPSPASSLTCSNVPRVAQSCYLGWDSRLLVFVCCLEPRNPVEFPVNLSG